MKSVLFLLITTSALAASLSTEECAGKYSDCFASIASLKDIANWPDFTVLLNIAAWQDKDRVCNSINSALSCVTTVAQSCHPSYAYILDGYQKTLAEGCLEKSNVIFSCILRNGNKQFWNQCLSKNVNLLQDNTLCKEINTPLKCYMYQMRSDCRGDVTAPTMDNFLKTISDHCEKVIGTEIDSQSKACVERISSCNFNMSSCHDTQRIANCILNALPTCGAQDYKPLLQRIILQIPEYCLPESRIRQDWKNSYKCILNKHSEFTQCAKTFAKDLENARAGKMSLYTKKLDAKEISAFLKFSNCYVHSSKRLCGKEAEYSLNYMMQPMKDYVQTICMDRTGAKCSGAIGLTSSFAVVFFSILYVSFKRND